MFFIGNEVNTLSTAYFATAFRFKLSQICAYLAPYLFIHKYTSLMYISLIGKRGFCKLIYFVIASDIATEGKLIFLKTSYF